MVISLLWLCPTFRLAVLVVHAAAMVFVVSVVAMILVVVDIVIVGTLANVLIVVVPTIQLIFAGIYMIDPLVLLIKF